MNGVTHERPSRLVNALDQSGRAIPIVQNIQRLEGRQLRKHRYHRNA
jgi:hypothetical protein